MNLYTAHINFNRLKTTIKYQVVLEKISRNVLHEIV